eukprot:1006065-Rhodomonas_salina.1
MGEGEELEEVQVRGLGSWVPARSSSSHGYNRCVKCQKEESSGWHRRWHHDGKIKELQMRLMSPGCSVAKSKRFKCV